MTRVRADPNRERIVDDGFVPIPNRQSTPSGQPTPVGHLPNPNRDYRPNRDRRDASNVDEPIARSHRSQGRFGPVEPTSRVASSWAPSLQNRGTFGHSPERVSPRTRASQLPYADGRGSTTPRRGVAQRSESVPPFRNEPVPRGRPQGRGEYHMIQPSVWSPLERRL